MRDLTIAGRAPSKPKDPEKPKINIEEVSFIWMSKAALRNHLEFAAHRLDYFSELPAA